MSGDADGHGGRLAQGEALLRSGRLLEAEQVLTQIVAADKSALQGRTLLLDSLIRQGRGNDAIGLMEEILALDPEQIGVAEQLVQAYLFREDIAGAETCAVRMAAQAPDSVRHVTLLGWLYRTLQRDEEAVPFYRMASSLAPESAELAAHLAATVRQAGRSDEAGRILHRALRLDPNSIDATVALADIMLESGDLAGARALMDDCDDRVSFPRGARRSVVIPVLDYSPGSPYNIRTLLDDLARFDGEVICIFNGDDVFEELRGHPRIDKWSYNKFNVGVGRGWNMGIQQAEGEVIHVLNADLKISVEMLYRLEQWVKALPDALCVGVTAHWVDYDAMKEVNAFSSGSFTQPIIVDQVSGQLFTLHAERLHDAGITFDPRLSPYFGEETDLSFKARQAGLRIYAVPEADYAHSWGISRRDRPILYFNRPVHRLRHMLRNQILLRGKWQRIKHSLPES